MIVAFIKANWRVIAGLLFVLVVSALVAGYGWKRGYSTANAQWQTKWQARDLADKQAELAARKDATEKSNRLAAAQEQAAQAYEKGKQDAENEASATIAAYRAGTVRLRQQFTCFNRSVSNATTSTGISDAARDCGLSERDVEFLIRFAERADKVAHQLKAAQDIIRADRAVMNEAKEK